MVGQFPRGSSSFPQANMAPVLIIIYGVGVLVGISAIGCIGGWVGGGEHPVYNTMSVTNRRRGEQT